MARRWLLAMLISFSFLLPSLGLANKAPEISLSEFYFFDAKDTRFPLVMTRSILVRFISLGTSDERQRHLQTYNPSRIRPVGSVFPKADFILEFSPFVNLGRVIEIMKQMALDSQIEVAPVFLVDGIEAVVDGFYLETRTPLSPQTIKNALEQRVGNNFIHEITPAGNAWHVSLRKLFFFLKDTPPTHVLSLANLIHKGEESLWLKRAYPKFVFLHSPVLASLSVLPQSGTVGEERTLVLRIRIFGKDASEVEIVESDIPEYFQGKFVPSVRGKMLSHSAFITHPRSSKKSGRVLVGPNEWLIEHSYVVGIHVPEREIVITGIKIPYLYKGERFDLDVPPVTFFVRAHLDNLFKIDDIPEPLFLEIPAFGGFSEKEPALIEGWFDRIARVVGGRKALMDISLIAVVAFSFLGLLSLFFLILPFIKHADSKEGTISRDEFDLIVGEATAKENAREALATLQDIVSRLFSDWNKAFPKKHLTYQNLKEKLREMGEDDLLKELEGSFEDGGVNLKRLFEIFELRNSPEFDSYSKADRDALVTEATNSVLALTEKL